MAAELGVAAASPFVQYVVTPIGRQCSYILFYKRYLRELKEGADNLKVELEDVQRECRAAERNARDIKEKVTIWIDKANVAVKKADKLLRGEEEANTVILLDEFQSCFKRCIRPPGSPSQQGNTLRVFEFGSESMM